MTDNLPLISHCCTQGEVLSPFATMFESLSLCSLFPSSHSYFSLSLGHLHRLVNNRMWWLLPAVNLLPCHNNKPKVFSVSLLCPHLHWSGAASYFWWITFLGRSQEGKELTSALTPVNLQVLKKKGGSGLHLGSFCSIQPCLALSEQEQCFHSFSPSLPGILNGTSIF